ncbi:FtsX-like permease family protein [Streptomyces sp. K1PN6]|uniref:FtsX-like permease family protein n=2 Tax=Streptomyces acidicola TaxID=2596892 RepID=A0A5N8WZF1_9ACTN|nr:FtsX-like permease family protein [Streptomyces acidicola]
MAAMGLGLAETFDAPEREPRRFASSPVVVMGRDTLTVEVRRGPESAQVTKKLAHPHPVDARLLTELRELGRVRMDGTARDAVGVDAVGVDAVGVDAPVAAVREVVGDRARVLTGDDRRQADPSFEQDAEALVAVNSLLGTAAGVTAFVSVFVTASTFAFVVALRRREFGLLRLAGATPGQVRRVLLGEALAVGVVASAAGRALGAWGAPLLVRELVDGGVAPSWFALRGEVTWPYHVAFWTGVSVALSGAWAAAWRAGRTGPVEALREASVDTGALPWFRRAVGVVLLAGGLGLLAWKAGTDPADLLKRKTYTTRPMLLITAVAALAPLLVRPAVRLLALPLRPVRGSGATGLLVRENAAAAVRRTAAVAAPVLVTVALAGSLLGSASTVAAAKSAEARERTRADVVVTGEDLGAVRDSGALRALDARRAEGAAVSPSASTAVYVREEGSALVRSDARAVSDVAAFAAVSRLPVVAGDVRDLDDRSIVVNEEWERHEVGAWVRVWLGDGRPARLRIVAVLARGTGDNGAYVTTANAPGARVDRLEVRAGRGTDQSAVVAALRSVSGSGREVAGGTVEVRSAAEWLAATRPGTGAQTRLGLFVVLGIALVYAGIALAGTLLMATSARDAELRALRLAGATRGQVLGAVVGETLLAVAVGAGLGLAVTAVNLAGPASALGRLSAPVTVDVPWGVIAGCAGACAVIAGVTAGVATVVRMRAVKM